MKIAIAINLPVKQKKVKICNRGQVVKEGQVINEGNITAQDFVVLNGDEVINKGNINVEKKTHNQWQSIFILRL